MLMVMASAGAVFVMFMMVLMVVVMVFMIVMMFMFVVVVFMIVMVFMVVVVIMLMFFVIVASAGAVLVMFMMMFVIMLMIVVFMIVVMVMSIRVHMRAIGDAVVAAIGVDRQTEEALLTQPGSAQCAGTRPDGAVVEAAMHLVFFFMPVLFILVIMFEDGEAGDVVVAGVAQQTIDMDDPVAVDAIQPEHAGAFVVDRVAAHFGTATERCVRNAVGQATVNHVDRATDGATAEQQGARTFQHFYLVSEERFDADGVVGTDRGGIQ